MKKKVTELKEELRAKEKQILEKDSEVEKLKNEISVVNRNIEKHKCHLKEFKKERKAMQEKIASAEYELKRRKRELVVLKTFLEKEKEKNEELNEIIQWKESEIVKLGEEVSLRRTELEEKSAQLQKDLLRYSKELIEKSELVRELEKEKAVTAAENCNLRASMELLIQAATSGVQFMEVS